MQVDTPSRYAEIIDAAGAEFQGIQNGPRGALILFADPNSRSTLAVAESDFTLEAVVHKLEEIRPR